MQKSGSGPGALVAKNEQAVHNDLYRRFFEHAPLEVHVWQVVRDSSHAIVTWRLVDANPAALASWGCELDAVIGKTANEIWPDSDPVRTFLPVVEEIMASGRPKQWEIAFGGTSQVLRMLSVPLGDCFISTGADVTSERTRALELEHALQQVTQATQAGGVGLWDWDPQTGTVRYSDEWKRQLGYAPDEITDSFEEWRSRVHPNDLQSALAAVRAALDDPRRTYDVTLRLRHRDGSYRWILGQGSVFRDEAGRPVRMVGSQIDITEQRRLRADLELERDKHRIMLRNASDGMCIINEQGCIEEVSDSFGSLLGYERDEMLGMHISAWDASLDAAGIEAIVAQTIAGGRRVQFETRHRRKDGGILDVEVSAVPFQLEGRALLFCLSRDIAQRKKAQQELEAARNNLEEQVAQRTVELSKAVEEARAADRAKSVFLSSMSHELRTPLNTVLGYAQLLSSAPPTTLGSAQREQARQIESSAEHLLALVNDLLDLAMIESGQVVLDPKPVDVLPMLLRVRDGLAPLAQGADVEVSIDTQDVSPWAHADPVRLQQCVINLVSNGIKYNRPGGRVRVEARADREGVVIGVADTGRGMSSAQLAHLFERFNRLGIEGSDIEGSGIGLVITRELVRQMGGRIEVESVPDRGTTFRIRLLGAAPPPLEDAPVVALTAPEAPPHETPPIEQHVEVLYIEDNEANVALMQAMASRRPAISLRIARSGQQAISCLQERGARLVLIDMNLGDCHGLELIERLRREVDEPGRMYVAVSADASQENIDQAMATGFDRYITKPVRLGTLLGLFDDVLQQVSPFESD